MISAAPHYATESDVEALRSIFDPVVYAEENPDVVALVGNDPEALFANFRDYGVYQGRCCNADFDVEAYRSAYGDLQLTLQDDVVSYYTHYALYSQIESRTITTFEACAKNGIVVTDFQGNVIPYDPMNKHNRVYFQANAYSGSAAGGNSSSGSSGAYSGYNDSDDDDDDHYYRPSASPSVDPSDEPSSDPSELPSEEPSNKPTETVESEESATVEPTEEISLDEEPTFVPNVEITTVPNAVPCLQLTLS